MHMYSLLNQSKGEREEDFSVVVWLLQISLVWLDTHLLLDELEGEWLSCV